MPSWWDLLWIAYHYGSYLWMVVGGLVSLGALRCCCVRGAPTDPPTAVPGQQQHHHHHYNAAVTDKYVCSLGFGLALLLPFAIFALAVAVRDDYRFHRDECEQSVYHAWIEQKDIYCGYCIKRTDTQRSFNNEVCERARHSASSVRYHELHTFDPCQSDSYQVHLDHNYTACAWHAVLSHVYDVDAKADAPDSYRSITWIKTLSNTTEYIAAGCFVLACAVLVYCWKVPAAMGGRALEASRQLTLIQSQEKKHADELSAIDHLHDNETQAATKVPSAIRLLLDSREEPVRYSFGEDDTARQLEVERLRSDPIYFPPLRGGGRTPPMTI